MKLRHFLLLPTLLLSLGRCGGPTDLAETEDETDAAELSVSDDNLNGLWVTTLGGQKLADDTVIESWSAVGVRMEVAGATYALTRSGDTLTAANVALTVAAHGGGLADDVIEGTVGGKTVRLARDVSVKPPITLALPGDRSYRSFLTELLIPAAQRDRESYTTMRGADVWSFMKSCELYKHGSWQRTFMKGATWSEQSLSLSKVAWATNNLKTTPRGLIHQMKFINAVTANVKDPSLVPLALSTFSMYLTTGAGRSIHIPITNDSTAYFITDRPSRAERIGLVVMDTPTHGPLASTFGRQLLDLGAMPAADGAVYARTMMEMLAKSDVRRASQLSATGRSALTDWFAVMAIEDYRGIVFGWPTLGWGYNLTNAQFYGLVVRALARPDQKDSAGNPILGQVIVGNVLKPGEASYADVLNGGNDMQEYTDMATLKTLATQYLREKRPQLALAVEAAFAGVVPKGELDYRAQRDIFHFVCGELYDVKGRTANLKGASADAVVDAVSAVFDALSTDSAAFEAYLLAHGITKSNDPAPKSTGF
jgi:hypothetical protein